MTTEVGLIVIAPLVGELYHRKRKMIRPVEEEDVWSDVYLRSSLGEWLATHEWIVSWLTLLCGTMMR